MIALLARGIGVVAVGAIAALGATTPANAAAASNAGFAVTASDTEAPTTPTNLMVEGTTPTTATVVWTWSTDNVDVVDYEIRYNQKTIRLGGNWAKETLYGLTPGTRYSISVTALDAAGNRSAPSAPVNATTVEDRQAPTAPTNLTGQPGPDAVFFWNGSTDDSDLIIYSLYLDDRLVTQVYNQTFAYVPLELTGRHTLYVRASDEAGNTSARSNTLTFDLP